MSEFIKSVEIQKGVTSSGNYALYNCPWLEIVTPSSGMKEILNKMFVGCISLKTVVIPEGVEAIGESAFATCPALESVSVPASLTTLGPWVFAGSFNPEAKLSFTVPETVTSVDMACFANTGLREVIWNANTSHELRISQARLFLFTMPLALFCQGAIIAVKPEKRGVSIGRPKSIYASGTDFEKCHPLYGPNYPHQCAAATV